ncbi:nicotinamide/nicotinic acid mononucleotide adenylyltransferase 3 isoform X1 [Drosophila biarmipes]|uniref:nicotinamide/nicotinic acid mononucleotide adenylyltransferase 3 isoform X1 n=1 Tax=Drosophila biarmipes TaxID=125945 RepID=UPI0007E8AFA4|nr:nicotinamide/nicotinic acid mononucleotide adenylyltransferase 3 isoform X1 [Drosophila biarmipes]
MIAKISWPNHNITSAACRWIKIYRTRKKSGKMSAFIEETKSLLPRIAFIACGCFSPPTPMHLRMFEIARDHFEMQGTHRVVGGIISPTHDSYGKKGLASALDRCAMVKLATQSSNWIRLSDWEVHQNQWMRTQAVLQHHQNYINNHINSGGSGGDDEPDTHLAGWLPRGLHDSRDPVRLKLLCGGDLLESFAVPGLWEEADIENIVANHGLVVITRAGSNPGKFIFDSDILTKYQNNITLITNWVPNEVSSSLIRRLLGRGQSVKYLLDDLVLEYIKRQRLFNYKPKYITDAVRPNHLLFNHAYTDNNKNTSSYSVSDQLEQDMDESDTPSPQLQHTATSRVFCCGEATLRGTKLLRSGPGQAVQVITMQADEKEESQAKKQKISQVQL